jgi:serine/threonine-protein kinase
LKTSVDANPTNVDDWIGYGELSLFLGRPDDYLRARMELLNRFGATDDPSIAERTSRACMLLPIEGEGLQKAVALADRAVAAKATADAFAYRYFLFAKGLANYREGRLDAAREMMEGGASGVMGPGPRLIVAMVQHRQGKPVEARKTLAGTVPTMDWTAATADSRDLWIWHVLRREAEQMILPNLPALISRSARPQDNDERLALLGVCQFKGFHSTAAQLYLDAFAAAPELAQDRRAPHLYNAARFAALAGSGRGQEAKPLSDMERTRWRDQARAWLRAELAARIKDCEGGDAHTCASLRQRLIQWRVNKDFDGICNRVAIDALPSAEKEECLSLWRAVDVAIERPIEVKPEPPI